MLSKLWWSHLCHAPTNEAVATSCHTAYTRGCLGADAGYSLWADHLTLMLKCTTDSARVSFVGLAVKLHIISHDTSYIL